MHILELSKRAKKPFRLKRNSFKEKIQILMILLITVPKEEKGLS